MSVRVFAIATLLAIAIAIAVSGCSEDAAVAEPPRPVLVVTPGAGSAGIEAYAGDVRARRESTLAFRVGGNIVERRVDVGDRVRRGDVLAVIDAGDFQAQARAAGAQLAAAQAEATRANADRARFAALGRDKLVSRSAVDAQTAAAAAAQGQVNAARAQFDVARNQAAYTQLRAPVDGVVATRLTEAGQVVAAGQPVFALAADGAREVVFAVPEGAIKRFRVGQPVQVETWSQTGQRWPGTVRELSPSADPASRTYQARVAVVAPDDALALGQSARVYVQQDGVAALHVPMAALQRNGAATAVWVVDRASATLRLQPVRIGPFAEDSVPITGGLKRDDWVVAAGGHLLRAGQKVQAVDRDNRPLVPVATSTNATTR